MRLSFVMIAPVSTLGENLPPLLYTSLFQPYDPGSPIETLLDFEEFSCFPFVERAIALDFAIVVENFDPVFQTGYVHNRSQIPRLACSSINLGDLIFRVALSPRAIHSEPVDP